MVSDRRLRKAIERMQAASAATYDKRIQFWFQPGLAEDLRGADGSKLDAVHMTGMRAVLHQYPSPDVASRLLMEGACFEVLARRVGRPAGVLAPEVIYALAIACFQTAAKEYAGSWNNDFRAMSVDELGMCFTYSMHRMVRDVGPWPGSDEELWSAWHRASQQWLSGESGRESNSIVLASGNHPDPNQAFAYAYQRTR